MIPAREQHAEEMADIFLAAFQHDGPEIFRLITDLCIALYWMDGLRHIMVIEDTETGNLAGWFSLRERSRMGTNFTKVKPPELWEIRMHQTLRARIQQLGDVSGLRSAIKRPPNRPAELIAKLLASHLLDERPDIIERNFFVLDVLVVNPLNQRQGVGRELLRYACDFASQHGLRILTQSPERKRFHQVLSEAGFRTMSGVSIIWGDNFEAASGSDLYCSMEFLPQTNA